MLKIKNDTNVVKRTSAANIECAEKNRCQTMIDEAAYYLAQKRGFIAGHEMDDWLEAEKEIMNQ